MLRLLQRDSEQRESLSQTIRALRADGLRQTADLERLQAKHAEAQRRLGLAEATERALKMQLRSAEQAARGLKEEMGRMRILVAQTRTACGNEVRRRERVIEGLKKHVGEGGRPRGSGKAVGVATITVVAGVGGDEANARAVATSDSGYDLRMETNEFLTELAKGLSEENENLGGLVRRTVETLKTLSGWEREDMQEGGMVVVTDSGYENMAAEMDGVIEHLRTLLTNPSFVPLEEVEVREDEIIRLREGWEKMEARWREAVQMMDGWRKRMTKSGQTVKLEELTMGLKLSPLKEASIEDFSQEADQDAADQDEGDTQADIDAMDDSQVPASVDPTSQLDELDSDVSSHFDEDIQEDSAQSPTRETQDVSQEVSQQQEDSFAQDDSRETQRMEERQQVSVTLSSSSPAVDASACLSPLRETPNTGNRRKEFTTIIEENTWDLAQIDQSSSSNENLPSKGDRTSPRKPSSAQTQRSSRKPPASIQPTGSSRLPRPASAMPQQSPLTMASIAAKLAATEREADAARVRAKLKAAKLSSAATVTAAAASTTLEAPTAYHSLDAREPEKESAPLPLPLLSEDGSRKRKAASRSHGGKVSRRRSTLSPWELESLILGGDV